MAEHLAYTHSYFDDLESIFYVLCYLTSCYSTTGLLKPNGIPRRVKKWFSKSGGWEEKAAMICGHTLTLAMDDSFQPPVSELLARLHRFFFRYAGEAMNFDVGWQPEPEEAYDGFLHLLTPSVV